MLKSELAAEKVLKELAITSPLELRNLHDLELAAFERGAIVQHKPLTGAEARINIVKNAAIITVSSHISNIQRRRFSVAHELGHFELHRWESHSCTERDISDGISGTNDAERENEANQFAISLMLPRWYVKPRFEKIEPSLESISQLASELNVSLTATALRFLEFTHKACAVVFSHNGRIQWFRSSEEFRGAGVFLETRVKIDPESKAAAIFADPTRSNLRRNVRASVWFSPGRYRRDASVIEDSLPMPSLNSVLTLLWIDDDIWDDDIW